MHGFEKIIDTLNTLLRELLEDNLKAEERHLDRLEAQRDQIAQMGIENYLADQTGE